MTVAGTTPHPLVRLALFPLACLLLVQAAPVLTGAVPVLDGALLDTDAYMRLNRVISLHDGSSWFDPRYPRIDPPQGHALHWTRPLDILLLAGAAPLEPLLGFRGALHVWGVLVNPLLTAGALLALLWASAPVLSRRGRILAGCGFALQPAIMAYGGVGRPDHHGLLLLVLALLLVLTPRLVARPEDGRAAWAAGATSALGVWVSIEALTFAAVALAAVGIVWLRGGATGMARAGLRYAAACALMLAAALALERGPAAWSMVENDRLSLLHVALFGAVALFWATALFAEHMGLLHRPRTRALAAVVGGGLIAAGLYGAFPQLGAGPMGAVDPLYRELHLSWIAEIQPLVTWSDLVQGDWGRAADRLLTFAGFVLVAAPYVVLRLARERRRGGGAAHPLWLFTATGLAVFAPLSVYQLRWSAWAQLLALIPYAALLDAALRGLERRLTGHPLALARPMAAACGLFWALSVPLALPRAEVVTAAASCPTADIARSLRGAGGGGGRTIMALPDYGPELLYRTGHNVLSIPHHRPQPGFGATYHALTTEDEATARALLERHGVDWVLLCPSAAEQAFYQPDRSPENLYRRLLEGRGPLWLRPVTPPDPPRAFALFEVVAAGGAAGDGTP